MTLDLRDLEIAGRRTSAPMALGGAEAWPALIFFAGSAAVLTPFLLFQHLPMVDYANHLARLYILSALGDDPLRRMYAISWTPIPNLGIDLLYAGVRAWLTPEIVIKLAVTLSASLILGSVYIIQKKIFGRISYAAALAPLFVHGVATYMGYLNYLMGVGLGFAGFALFFVAGRRLTAPLAAVLSCLGVLIYLCHIAAFGAYILILGILIVYPAITSSSVAGIRRVIAPALAAGLIAAPGALLYIVSEKPAPADGIIYDAAKLRILVAPTFASADIAADKAVLIGAIVLLFAMHRLQALRLWRPGVPVLAALLAVILALPDQIDKAVDVDARLVLFLVFISLSMLELWPPTARVQTVVSAAIVALIAVCMWNVLAVGYEYERQVAEFRSASGRIMPGDKVLIADDTRTTSDCNQAPTDLPMRPLLTHIGSYLTIDRRAFVPLVFADRGMQPIRPIGEYKQVSASPTVPVPIILLKYVADPSKRDAAVRALAKNHVDDYFFDWRKKFDDVVILHHGCASDPFPGELVEVGGGHFFSIYRILRE